MAVLRGYYTQREGDMRPNIIIGVLAMCVGACSYRPIDVANPSQITLEQGMREVAIGVATMRDELQRKKTRLGVVVDEVTVDFNLAASATDTSQIKLDLSRPVSTGTGIT